MSGAYEMNWKKHPVLHEAVERWQNRLPLYNTRISNLSAAVVLHQLAEVHRRVRDGRANHDQVVVTQFSGADSGRVRHHVRLRVPCARTRPCAASSSP